MAKTEFCMCHLDTGISMLVVHSDGVTLKCFSHYPRERRRYMFFPVFVCLSSVSKITQKHVLGFG